MNIFSYFFPQTIAEFDSKFNGKILVKEAFGSRFIEVGGLMQSGRIPEKLYTSGIKKLHLLDNANAVSNVLILGLGGGTVIKVLNTHFLQSNLLGVDIDPIIVDVGKKYLELGNAKNLQILIADVFDEKSPLGKNYDLIIVDLFKGYEIPSQLGSKKFLTALKQKLSQNGRVIFNRLYFQKYKNEADEFLDKVRQIFQDITVVKNYFNILISAK